MFFTYIIQSDKDKSLYIGFTKDLKSRLIYHNKGLSTYTSKKVPWKLVYFEKYENKTEALKRERFLKKQKNKEFYSKLIKDFTES